MPALKLLALDDEDLKVVSAHLQDAVVRVQDMAYEPKRSRFAALLNRFDWQDAGASGSDFQRRRTALRFDRVLGAQIKNINLDATTAVLSLLSINFEPSELPEGHVTLTFAGGGSIRLHVECVEAELRDLGPVWNTPNKPTHAAEEADPEPSASPRAGAETKDNEKPTRDAEMGSTGPTSDREAG